MVVRTTPAEVGQDASSSPSTAGLNMSACASRAHVGHLGNASMWKYGSGMDWPSSLSRCSHQSEPWPARQQLSCLLRLSTHRLERRRCQDSVASNARSHASEVFPTRRRGNGPRTSKAWGRTLDICDSALPALDRLAALHSRRTYAWAWGANKSGDLGDNSRDQSLVPIAVEMPANVTFTAISAGSDYSLALDTDGHAWAWGANESGQLGNNSRDRSLVPVAVDMPANVAFSAISAEYDHSLALDTAGQGWAWGDNQYGQLGTSTVPTNSPEPVAVEMPANLTFTAISAGYNQSLAVDRAGLAWRWGYNGSATPDHAPVAFQTPTNVTFSMISAGAWGSLALQPASHQ